MTACDEIIGFLNAYLNVSQIPDLSQNGLQVDGPKEINKIAFGVSASKELFVRAKTTGAQLIVVHHGILWGKEQRLTGSFGERVRFLMQNGLALAGYHLPLDLHPVVGHNACLIKHLGGQDVQPFGQYHGAEIGYKARVDLPLAEACSVAILRSCSMTSAGQSASEIETGAMAVACMATVWATSAGTSLLKPRIVPSFLLKCT